MISKERAKEITELYYDDVYQLCLFRLRKDYLAHDVAQDVFLLFQERCDGLEDDKIKNWLYSVAAKKIKEEFKAIAKREKELIFGDRLDTLSSSNLVYKIDEDNMISDEEIEKEKGKILAALTDKELELFEMVYIKHMQYSELAKALGVTESTARTRVYRLRLRIKEKVYHSFMVLILLVMKL